MIEVTIVRLEANEAVPPYLRGPEPIPLYHVRFWKTGDLVMVHIPCQDEDAAIAAAREILNGKTDWPASAQVATPTS